MRALAGRLTPPILISITVAVLAVVAAFGVTLTATQQAATVAFVGAAAVVFLVHLTVESIAALAAAGVAVAVAYGIPVTAAQEESILILAGTVASIVLGKAGAKAVKTRRAKPVVTPPSDGMGIGETSPGGRRYGWLPGLPGVLSDPADLTGLDQVAVEVDPRSKMPPVFDQGQLGSCTANATAAAFQYDGILDQKDPGLLSRLWIYYQERKIEHSLGQGDTGAYGHDAFIAAQKTGVPAEATWPYDISTFEGPPPKAATHGERHYKLTKAVHAVPQNETAIKQVLSNGQTVAFGFTVYSSFESATVARTGVVPLPKRGEKVLGGHEVLIVGYLKSHPACALVRNSWGADWGIGGYFLMPWSYIVNPKLASDHRTIVRPL